MDGHAVHAVPVRVSRTPAPAPPPPAAPGTAPPIILPRHNRVAVAPPAAPERHHHRGVDPRLLEARYEYPFPDDASLPCCAPPPPRRPSTALSKEHGAVLTVDDYEDRDPNRINQHLQLLWEDVVAEPDGVRSPDLTWRGSARLFRLTRDLVYAFLSCFLGPPVAVLLGGGFAIIAFVYIWCVSPTLRACRVTLGALNTLVRAVTHSTVAPVTEALGYLCANIRVRVQNAEAGRHLTSASSQPLLNA